MVLTKLSVMYSSSSLMRPSAAAYDHNERTEKKNQRGRDNETHQVAHLAPYAVTLMTGDSNIPDRDGYIDGGPLTATLWSVGSLPLR